MLPQLVVSGITSGMLYALIALSMTVVYRATTVVNFGHGDMVAAGAYAAFVAAVGLGVPFIAALALAIALLFVFGVLMQRLVLQPISAGPHLSLAMMALAVGYAIRGAERLEWGNDVLNLARPYPRGVFMLGSVVVTTDDLVITGFVLVLLLVLFAFFHLTPIGRIIQAVFQSERGAALVGINVRAFHAVTWGAGAALGAVGGVLIALIVPLTPDMGQWVLIQGFAAMTLGGFGSLFGSVVGGVLLGVMQKVLGFYVGTVFIDITAYLATILVLLIRPSGLFGRPSTVRV
ncbi:MAG TPA: branched-chain amino acid ABC transporter permease [Acetobacteraceae bacterium]|nr:branched-chain amino acid ABC transporter permease [Acetobacteraceae bacterium]